MSHYPRIVACPITGIVKMARSYAEEREFHRQGVAALAWSMGLGIAALAAWFFWWWLA